MNVFINQRLRVVTPVICGGLIIALIGELHAATFRGLGIPTGAVSSEAGAVSGDGMVVVGTADPDDPVTRFQGFVWTKDAGIDLLDPLPGYVPGVDSLSSRAGLVSSDGSVIVGGGRTLLAGQDTRVIAARWTEGLGSEILITGTGFVTGLSSDGSIIVGSKDGRAFWWSAEEGINYLNFNGFKAAGISADGTIIAGGREEAWRWLRGGEAARLGYLNGDNSSLATAISADGQVIVGRSDQRTRSTRRPFRWTADTGMVPLFESSNPELEPLFLPNAASANGDVVISGGGVPNLPSGDPLIWDSLNGVRYFERSLAIDNDLGFQMAGWEDLRPEDISDDGRTIVGHGRNPVGHREGWIVRLDDDSASIPPVAGVSEIGGSPVTSASVNGLGELISFTAEARTYAQQDLIQPVLTSFSAIGDNSNLVVPSGAPVPSPGSRSGLLTSDFRLDSGIVNPDTDSTAATLTFAHPLVNGPGSDLVIFEVKRSLAERPAELPDDFQLQIDGVTGVIDSSSWGPALATIDIEAYSRDEGRITNLIELENGSFTQPSLIVGMEVFGVAIDLDDFGVPSLARITDVSFGGIGTQQSIDPVLFMGINSAQFIPEPSSLMLISSCWGLIILARQGRRNAR